MKGVKGTTAFLSYFSLASKSSKALPAPEELQPLQRRVISKTNTTNIYQLEIHYLLMVFTMIFLQEYMSPKKSGLKVSYNFLKGFHQ